MGRDELLALYGVAEPPAAARSLRAGPLDAEFTQGNLRYLRWGGHEILRAVGFVVRDRVWGTYQPTIAELRIDEAGDEIRVSYLATCTGDDGEFRYRARIALRADGLMSFDAEGAPAADFPTSRAGFVVLHPIAGLEGLPVEVEHVDGTRTPSRFPDLIAPWQPMSEIRAMTHAPLPGLRVACRLDGDAYEMEDHRNWGDASYKTYSRPLARGAPYTLAAGETLHQRVELRIEGALPPQAAATGELVLGVGGPAGRAPAIALAVDGADAAAALTVAHALRTAAPRPLVARIDTRRGAIAADARAIAALAHALGAAVSLEALIPARDLERELEALADGLRAGGLAPVDLSPLLVRDLRQHATGTPAGEATKVQVLLAARHRFPALPIGGAVPGFFTELNRNPPPAEGLAFVAHGFSGTIHAADDHSVMETLQSIAPIAHSVRAMYGALPWRIDFVSLAMRVSPYGGVPVPNPQRRRVAAARFDPRQGALFAAAFTLGVAARAARAGVDRLGLGMPLGDFGLLGEDGTRRPLLTLADGLASCAGARLRTVASSAADMVDGFAVERGDGVELWLSNLTPAPVELRVAGAVPRALAVMDVPALLASPGESRMVDRSIGGGRVRLAPYAVARLALYEQPGSERSP